MSDLAKLMFRAPALSQVLAVDEIDPDPDQPRKSFDDVELQGLADSMEALGQLQPILVRPSGGRYVIVAGERRWRAQKLRGHPTIEAKILAEGVPVELAQPAENTNRAALTPKETLDAVGRATAAGFTREQIAKALGVSVRTVANYRQIASDEEAAAAIDAGGGVRKALTQAAARRPPGVAKPEVSSDLSTSDGAGDAADGGDGKALPAGGGSAGLPAAVEEALGHLLAAVGALPAEEQRRCLAELRGRLR